MNFLSMEPVNLLKILQTDVSLRMQPRSPRHWALLTLTKVGGIAQNHHKNPCSESFQSPLPVKPRACERARGTPVLGPLWALVDKALHESQAEMNYFNGITESNHSAFPLPVLTGVRGCTPACSVYMVPVLPYSQKPQSNTLAHLQAHSSCPPSLEHTLGCCISC